MHWGSQHSERSPPGQRTRGERPCGSMLTPACWGLRPPWTPPQPHRSPQGPGPRGGGNFEARGCSWKGPWSLKVAATGLGSQAGTPSAGRWLNHRLTNQEALLPWAGPCLSAFSRLKCSFQRKCVTPTPLWAAELSSRCKPAMNALDSGPTRALVGDKNSVPCVRKCNSRANPG